MEQTVTYISIMRESLLRKKNYLNQILELTKQQESIIKQPKFDEEAFGSLIDEKESYINNINEIDKGFTSVYDRARSELNSHQDLYRDDLLGMQQSIKECVDLGMEIEALEERNRAELEAVLSTGFKGIKKLKQSKQVATKYYKSMSNGNINDAFLYDKKK